MDWGAVPRHYRLRAALVEKIASGQWAPHQPIPSERALEEMFKVSRTTVRRALDDLVRQGLVYREHGRGTFVAPVHDVAPQAKLLGFAEELERTGRPVFARALEWEVMPAAADMAGLLSLAEGDPVVRVHRVFELDHAPVLFVESFLPRDLGGPDLVQRLIETGSLYRAAELGGIIIARGEQRLRAVLIDEQTAERLGVPAGSPGLELTRTTYSLEGSPVEVSRAVYRGDRYEYVIDLAREIRSPDGEPRRKEAQAPSSDLRPGAR